MANRWLFGGGAEAVRIVNGALQIGANFDASYVDHSVKANSTDRVAVDFRNASGGSDSVGVGEKMFFHAVLSLSAGGASYTAENAIVFRDNSGFPWLSLRFTSATALTLFYNSGTGAAPAWTSLGLASYAVGYGLHTFDIWLTPGSPNVAGFAVEGSLIGEASFTQGALGNIAWAELRAANSGYRDYSEIMASVGISTIGGRLRGSKAIGAGTHSDFEGTFEDIDDAGVNDADAITSVSAGDRSTFVFSDVPALADNEALGDVFVWTRARNSGGAPSNVKPVRRSAAGVDVIGADLSGIAGAFQTFLTRYSGIDEAEFNASEFGVESAA